MRRAKPAGTRRRNARRTPKGIRVRRISSADRAMWVQLRHALWPHDSLEELARDARKLLRTERGGEFRRSTMRATVFVAELPSGRLAGFAEFDQRPIADGCRTSPVGYLEGWYVLPKYRRRGVGSALVRAGERWARAHGCTEMASDAHLENEVSRKAHRSLGFREMEELVHFHRPLNGPRS